jgi:chromosome segregation ATPase
MVKSTLESAKSAGMKTEASVKQVEDELAENEREFESRLVRVKALKDKLFKKSQMLHDLRMNETRIKNEVDGIRLTCRSMDVHLTALDKETARQQELLYNAEFQIQQSERKVSRALGVRSDSEKRQLKLQIEELDIKLEKMRDNKKLLVTQARKLLNELAASRMHKEVVILKRAALKEKIGEVELENRMVEEEIRRGTKGKEEITVSSILISTSLVFVLIIYYDLNRF